MRRDARGGTTPISYALTIVIATILITGLVIAGSTHVSDQRSRTAQGQMDAVAQQVAGSLEVADRLVRADVDDEPSALELERDLPRQIQTTGYSVTITGSDVVVSSPLSDRDVRVSYEIDPTTDIDTDTTVRGGTIVISWDTSSDELVVDDA